ATVIPEAVSLIRLRSRESAARAVFSAAPTRLTIAPESVGLRQVRRCQRTRRNRLTSAAGARWYRHRHHLDAGRISQVQIEADVRSANERVRRLNLERSSIHSAGIDCQ